MECKVTCFDRVMYHIKPLKEADYEEAYEKMTESSFIEFLDFLSDKGCISRPQIFTLFDGIAFWESLDSNYYELDGEKLSVLYDKVGLTEEICQEFEDKIKDLS